jgi:hypothetical protein
LLFQDSFTAMKKKGTKTDMPGRKVIDQEKDNLNGYPAYPAGEDIYDKYRKEKDINPEDTSKTKEIIEKNINGIYNEKDFNDDVSGSDLDIPGSELDDDQEINGSEDEENNYYSLGGDDHNDLDEDDGE